jgi:hypothetical protein
MRYRTLALIVFVLALPHALRAQPADPRFDRLERRWSEILPRVVSEHGLRLVDANGAPVSSVAAAVRVDGDPASVRAAYADAIDRLLADGALSAFYQVDPALISQIVRPTDQEWVAKLIEARTDEKSAKSLNAASTNPAAPRLAERSAFTDFLALALDTKNVVSADETAVSLSLNALSVLGLDPDSNRSAPALYRQHDALRRFGGTVTFGAKIPEGEITGLTGLPSAGTIFDVFAWDTKVRLIGDRDPRARKWDDLMLGFLGGQTEISANLIASVPSADRQLVASLLSESLERAKAVVDARLRRSGQVTFKAAGQHLTSESGKNKYTMAVLADKGLGATTDLTVNAGYSVVDDVSLGADKLVTLETWTAALALNHTRWRDVIVKGRAAVLSLNASFEFPVGDEPLLPAPRENVWRIVGAIELPWGDAAKIPVSVSLVSDPNNLSKDMFVSGHVGIAYDFSALKKFLMPQN